MKKDIANKLDNIYYIQFNPRRTDMITIGITGAVIIKQDGVYNVLYKDKIVYTDKYKDCCLGVALRIEKLEELSDINSNKVIMFG